MAFSGNEKGTISHEYLRSYHLVHNEEFDSTRQGSNGEILESDGKLHSLLTLAAYLLFFFHPARRNAYDKQ